MLGWAVFREGTLESWVRREVKALLRPYRAETRPYRRKPLIRKVHVRRSKKH
jgi:hypothetical protein